MSIWYAIWDALPFEMLHWDFMKNALLALLLMAPLFGILSTMIVTGRMSFFSDALGHSAFTGIAIGSICGMAFPMGMAVLLSAEVETVTGRGGGVTDESFMRKKAVIRRAIELNRPDRDDPVDVLSKVGGFDLAAMCGAFLGAAATRRPVVIDGFISAVAALCAVRLCPRVRDYLVPSHASFEIGYRLVMEAMSLEPLFLLGMRLGEGSGCPLAFQVLSAACAVMNDMATFDQAGIDDGYLDEIRQGDQFTVEGKA